MRNSIFPKREPGSNSWLLSFSWEQRKVREVTEDYVEKTVIQNQYPVLTSSQQQGIVLQEKYFADRQVTTSENIGYFVLPRGFFTYRSRSDTDVFVFNRNMLIDKGIISKYYPVFSAKDTVPEFLLRRLNFGIRKQLSMAAEGTGQKVLAHSKFKDMLIVIPEPREQEKIGAFFESLDRLITLHQCNYFFNATEMVSRNVEKTFSWEQRKLGDIAIFNPKSELPEKFEYVDLESVVGTEIIAHREEQKSTAPSRAQRLAQFGDLFYQTVRPYQKNNCLFESHCKSYVFSTGYAQIRPFLNGYFLLSLVQSDFFVKRVLDRCTGTSYPAINSNDLAEMSIKKPCDKREIEKIGQFFKSLDCLITLHQRECFFSRIRKKLKITSQKTNAWEQREFENSFSLLQNNTLSRSELSESPGVAANIHYGDVLIKFGEYLDIEEETFPWIKKQTDADKFKMSFLQDGDIVFADTAEDETAGKCCEIRNCGSTVIISGLHTIPCRPESKFALGYLGYYLNSTAFHEQLIPLMQGTKVVSISKTALKSTNIQYPSDDKEQQKIGQFFRGLDRLITLHQRERLFLILEEILC